MKRLLGLSAALFFLMGMLLVTGPDLYLRRIWNTLIRARAQALRSSETRWQLSWARRYRRALKVILGMKLFLKHREELSARRPCIIVLNHRSLLDHLLAAEVAHRYQIDQLFFVAKRGLRRVPFIGSSLARAGSAFVSRNRDPDDLQRIQEMAELAREDGASVVIYPEGTRFTGAMQKGARYTALLDPKVAGFATLCKSLPNYKILIACIDWGNLPDARTIWNGSAYVGRQVKVNIWMENNPGSDEAEEFLSRTWEAMERLLADQVAIRTRSRAHVASQR